MMMTLLLQSINPTVYGSLSLLELIWLLVSAVGVGFTLANEHTSHDMIRAALAPPVDPVAVASARLDRIIQRTLGLVLVAYLALGAVGAYAPPPASRSESSVLSAATLVLLFAGPVLLAALSVLVNRRVAGILHLVGEERSARDGD